MRAAIRKLLAVTALLTLLLSGFSTLAETLCAAEAPICCNTDYCPLHHTSNQSGNSAQSAKSETSQTDCGAMRIPGQTDCSMRACDSTAGVAVQSVEFVPATTLSVYGPAIAEANTVSVTSIVPFVVTMPATPPPRA